MKIEEKDTDDICTVIKVEFDEAIDLLTYKMAVDSFGENEPAATSEYFGIKPQNN
ncbi:hypothetical protein [Paenibacillus sp. FSL H7-0714]|uniref:hypothetical protein n=1 Tax=Paenibacillus sp. FSL H7-0714 TaxID=2954735 RepID=UPI0030FC6DDE